MPRTPASSRDSREAASSTDSSVSHPPYKYNFNIFFVSIYIINFFHSVLKRINEKNNISYICMYLGKHHCMTFL